MKIFPLNLIPYDSKFDFMRLRWVSTLVFALLALASIGAMVGKGFNFALDFTGGVGIELRFDKAVDVDDVRTSLARAGYENATVQTFGAGNDLLIRLQKKPESTQDGSAPLSIAQDVQRVV